MAQKSQNQRSMHDLFIEQLRDLYDAEKQIEKVLPRLAKAATSGELKSAFEQHAEQTRGQVERLEQIFEKMDTKPRGKRCEAVAGLIEEAKELLQEGLLPEVLDVGLIAGAQKVEHYEIASYGSVREHAKVLGMNDVAALLDETLKEEKETDMRLNKIATSSVNRKGVDSTAGAAG